eukprot:TRINITY_DN17111_c0_g1_i1.p1 TRINITY_DN17111_c0_g1~~TRINITY_DN17111_c0_g1_i1.p1  ORF type:complete len:272 (+),score=42.97 TRINITY_DN17111_c0_g1_i1:54-869(+)
MAQIQRSIRAGYYFDKTPAVGWVSFDISKGEATIYKQYKIAFQNAKKFIYIENQHLADVHLIDLMISALKRGVEIVYVVPWKSGILYVIKTELEAVKKWEQDRQKGIDSPEPHYADLFLRSFKELSKYPNFCLCGLAYLKQTGDQYASIYVHSKIAIVDDQWLTIGSANLVDISFQKDHTELNISIWDNATAKSLRNQLFSEHLHKDSSSLDAVEAVKTFQSIAIDNRKRFKENNSLQGHAFALDVSNYGDEFPHFVIPSYQPRLKTTSKI